MKIFTKFITIIATLCIILCMLFLPASAASNATIIFSSNSIEVGKKVTVSVSINPKEAMYGVSFYLQYNDSVLKYNSGNGNENSAGVLKVVESPSGDKSVKYNFTFEALKAGTSAISVTDCVYVVNGENGTEEKSFTGASATLTVKDASLSSNAKLKSLKVSGYSLSPSFSSTTTSYTLKVPYDTKKINVTATASDDNAKVVSVEGNTNLKVGKNTVTVTVEAENGTQKKYKITVTRLENETSSQNSSSEETESDTEETTESGLLTTISGTEFTIMTKISEDILFNGFTVETKTVNGYEVETAVDENGVFRLFYLMSDDSEKLTPYLYDEVLDQFEKLKYVTIGERTYILTSLPSDVELPETLYISDTNIGGFSVECLSDTDPTMSDFHYVYCYSDGMYNFYRYDALEGTLHRFPDFNNLMSISDNNDGIFDRFATLSTNGKIIMIALCVLIIGVFALLIMLIAYLIKKSMNNTDDMILSSYDDDFDEIEIKNENNVLK